MGGAMVIADTDQGKALAWAKTRARVEANDNGPGDWSVMSFSVADEGIALLIEPGRIYFGVPGRGGETYPRDIERAFGTGFVKLKEAMAKTLAELVASGAVKLEAADIQAIAGAAGLGILEKATGGWALTTRDCQAIDLPTSGL